MATAAAHNMLILLQVLRQCQMSAHVICHAARRTSYNSDSASDPEQRVVQQVLHICHLHCRPPGSLVESLELTGLHDRQGTSLVCEAKETMMIMTLICRLLCAKRTLP